MPITLQARSRHEDSAVVHWCSALQASTNNKATLRCGITIPLTHRPINSRVNLLLCAILPQHFLITTERLMGLISSSFLLVLPLEGNSLWDSCRGSSNPCTRSIPLNARICDTTEDSLAVACLVIGSLAGASGHQYSQRNDSHLTLRGLMAQVLHDHRQSHLLRYEEDHEAFPFRACLSWFPHTKTWSQNTSIYSLRQYMVMSSIYCSGGRRWAVVDTDRGQNYVFLPAMSLDSGVSYRSYTVGSLKHTGANDTLRVGRCSIEHVTFKVVAVRWDLWGLLRLFWLPHGTPEGLHGRYSVKSGSGMPVPKAKTQGK